MKNTETQLKYAQVSTYQFEADQEQLSWLSAKVNLSKVQLLFLFQLVDGDFLKLKGLLTHMKNCFVSYCPGSVNDVEEVMALVPKKTWFTLEDKN